MPTHIRIILDHLRAQLELAPGPVRHPLLTVVSDEGDEAGAQADPALSEKDSTTEQAVMADVQGSPPKR